jgi:hypothetical protein
MVSIKGDKVIESFSRVFLEGFTTQELLSVAARHSVELPEGPPDRSFIIGEILDALEEGAGRGGRACRRERRGRGADNDDEAFDFSPDCAERARKETPRYDCFLRNAPPSKYNATYVKALVRDPFWVFVFWELKEALREKLFCSRHFAGLRLRLNSVERQNPVEPPDVVNRKEKICETFSADVGKDDGAWYLDFPDAGEKFFIELCALSHDGKEEALSRTAVFEKPAILSAKETPHKVNGGDSPLLILSGLLEIGDVKILREKNTR